MRKLFVVLAALVGLVRPAFVMPSAPWYGAWSNRKQITINHGQVSGTATLSSFPVLISITDANLQSIAKADGTDILFTASDGKTKLSHEIEQYSNSNGHLVAWVNVPTLSPSADTLIFMYYGNPAASDQQTPQAVWDANFLGVWHFPSTSTLSAGESTSHAVNGTITNASATTGKVAGAANFSGASSQIITSSSAILNNLGPITVSAWIHPNSSGGGGYGRIMDKSAGIGPAGGWYFSLANNCLEFQVPFFSSNLLVTSNSGNTIPAGSTAFVVAVWDGTTPASNAHLYINGVEVTGYTNRQNAAGARVADASQALKLGNVGDGNDRHFDGWLDEARISNSVRTPGWILTEYHNQNAPSTFFTVGTQQQAPPPVAVTLATVPAGLSLTADSIPCTAPCTFQWIPGSSHTIAAASQPGAGGTGVYVWSSLDFHATPLRA